MHGYVCASVCVCVGRWTGRKVQRGPGGNANGFKFIVTEDDGPHYEYLESGRMCFLGPDPSQGAWDYWRWLLWLAKASHLQP